ncbi:hypothetical protein U9M48_030975 [Paspalum notatum var. saurae]|uniref:Uncharacterized protein n=1 Tax=Paspalum notatum var. saurae TaxID=547442 RepID=A0AAQ3U1P4_PASNO
MEKFDRIIHVDCSRWKSRRALQRAIADELKLPRAVMAAFDRQDGDDDFSKVDESSRAEIEDVTREIYQTVRDLSCLLEEEDNQRTTTMECFRSLWVLDICHMDWELDLLQDVIEQMAANIREVHIKKGRIWHSNLAWRRLWNLRKLRVIEPTGSCETCKMDEVKDMVKLRLLDLSGNEGIQVLPSLYGATSLRSLVLDGCVGLEHVGTEDLPRSLESFSFDVDKGNANKLICISLAGCTRLSDFNQRGSFTILEEVDLSGTRIKTVDLKIVDVPCLQRLVLLACVHLRAILWPENGLWQLRLLCIDTRGGEPVRDASHGSLTTKDDGINCSKEMMVTRNRKGQIFHKGSCTYIDVDVGKIINDHNKSTAAQPQPPDFHLEFGDKISGTDMLSTQGIKAIAFVMNRVQSLHVHDNSSIAAVIPAHMICSTR